MLLQIVKILMNGDWNKEMKNVLVNIKWIYINQNYEY